MKNAISSAVLCLLPVILFGGCNTDTRPYTGKNAKANDFQKNSVVAEHPNDGGIAPTIRLIFDSSSADFGKIELAGLRESRLEKLQILSQKDWFAIFPVSVRQDSAARHDALPPIVGRYSIEQDRILFTPRFAFVPGLTYEARFDNHQFRASPLSETKNPNWVYATFTIPKPDIAATTFVTQVYPTSNRLPENLLRFYFHFSAPMRFGEAYQHIRLVDESGEAVHGAFLEIEQELWDAANQRFTLLFDPGRIKRELKPHLEEGLALAYGRSYELVVSQEWRDAKGNLLMKDFRKKFFVTKADRVSPNHRDWKITAPPGGSLQPLTLDFPEPLDRALLQRMITVLRKNGSLVDGELEISKQETRWAFKPSSKWKAGHYLLCIDTLLEDLAGNNLRNVFDVDM
ncbi:MAG: hypothetical protein ACE5I1_26290, partial [bacterium]